MARLGREPPRWLGQKLPGPFPPFKEPSLNVIAQLPSADDICLDLDASGKRRLLEEVGRLFADWPQSS
jgi:hypothetical protein